MSDGTRDKGFVLANALILIAALSAIAVAMLADRQSAQARIAISRDEAVVDALTDAGVLFAADLLRRDAEASEADHYGEAWSLKAFPVEVGDKVVEVTVTDLSGLFNINLIRGPEHEAASETLARYSELAEIDTGAVHAYVPPGAVRDVDDTPHLFLSGDIAHLSEITDDITALRDLSSVVVPLPLAQKINVNTASVELLSAATGLEEAAAQGLLNIREKQPFESIADFSDAVRNLNASVGSLHEPLLTTGSAWFLVETRAREGEVSRHMATILARNSETGDVRTFTKGRRDSKNE